MSAMHGRRLTPKEGSPVPDCSRPGPSLRFLRVHTYAINRDSFTLGGTEGHYGNSLIDEGGPAVSDEEAT